jgi:hypothetical protein
VSNFGILDGGGFAIRYYREMECDADPVEQVMDCRFIIDSTTSIVLPEIGKNPGNTR